MIFLALVASISMAVPVPVETPSKVDTTSSLLVPSPQETQSVPLSTGGPFVPSTETQSVPLPTGGTFVPSTGNPLASLPTGVPLHTGPKEKKKKKYKAGSIAGLVFQTKEGEGLFLSSNIPSCGSLGGKRVCLTKFDPNTGVASLQVHSSSGNVFPVKRNTDEKIEGDGVTQCETALVAKEFSQEHCAEMSVFAMPLEKDEGELARHISVSLARADPSKVGATAADVDSSLREVEPLTTAISKPESTSVNKSVSDEIESSLVVPNGAKGDSGNPNDG